MQKEKIENEQKYKYNLGVYNNNLDYYYVEMVLNFYYFKNFYLIRGKFMKYFKNMKKKE